MTKEVRLALALALSSTLAATTSTAARADDNHVVGVVDDRICLGHCPNSVALAHHHMAQNATLRTATPAATASATLANLTPMMQAIFAASP